MRPYSSIAASMTACGGRRREMSPCDARRLTAAIHDGLVELGQAVDPPPSDDDPTALVGERERRGAANTAGGAGDDGDGTVEVHGPPRPLAGAC